MQILPGAADIKELHWTTVRETWPGNLSRKQPVAVVRRTVGLFLQNDVTLSMTT